MAALPTTGLKLSDIIDHFDTGGLGTFTKLSECITAFDSDGANGTYYTSPCDRISDFKGYEHPSGVTVTAFSMINSGEPSGTLSCASGTSYTTFYHDGSGTDPALGDVIYVNNPGTTVHTGANQYWKINVFPSPRALKISSAGVVISSSICK